MSRPPFRVLVSPYEEQPAASVTLFQPGQHAKRVAAIGLEIAQDLVKTGKCGPLSGKDLAVLYCAGLLHDIGKMFISCFQ